jgi:hypothetical protein
MTFETRTVAAEFEMRDDSTTGAPIFEAHSSSGSTRPRSSGLWNSIQTCGY